MFRRDLFKLGVSSLAAALLPEGIRPMAGPGLGDQLADLLLRISEGDTLTPGELQALRLKANQNDAITYPLAGWQGLGGNMNPDLFVLYGPPQGFSALPFLEAFKVRLISAQTIPNNTETVLEWDTLSMNHGSIKWSSSPNPERIDFVGKKSRTPIVTMGLIQWETNGTGYRTISTKEFDKSDSMTAGATLAQLPAVTGVETIVPFAQVDLLDGDSTYMKVTVKQNSGGDLDVTFANFSVFRVF